MCDQCESQKKVCDACRRKRVRHWNPALRSCDRCLEKEVQCTRMVCLNLTTDSQSKYKAALELLQKQQEDNVATEFANIVPFTSVSHQYEGKRIVLVIGITEIGINQRTHAMITTRR